MLQGDAPSALRSAPQSYLPVLNASTRIVSASIPYTAFITETTFASLPAWDAAHTAHVASDEGSAVVAEWRGMNTNEGTWELYSFID